MGLFVPLTPLPKVIVLRVAPVVLTTAIVIKSPAPRSITSVARVVRIWNKNAGTIGSSPPLVQVAISISIGAVGCYLVKQHRLRSIQILLVGYTHLLVQLQLSMLVLPPTKLSSVCSSFSPVATITHAVPFQYCISPI